MENRVPVVSTRATVVIGVLLCLCAAEAARGQTPLRVVSSGFLRDTLEARLLAALSEAHSDLSLDWRDAGSRGALRDLFEGGADLAVTIQRVHPDEIRLAERRSSCTSMPSPSTCWRSSFIRTMPSSRCHPRSSSNCFVVPCWVGTALAGRARRSSRLRRGPWSTAFWARSRPRDSRPGSNSSNRRARF